MRKMNVRPDLSKLDKRYWDLYLATITDIRLVLPSPEFREAVKQLLGSYKVPLAGELGPLKNKPLEEVIELTIQAFEKELTIIGYYTEANVIGYGLPSDNKTRVNTRYLQGRSAKVALDRVLTGSNLLHEKNHDAGGDHDFKATTRRPNSWSYIFGEAYKIAFWRVFPWEMGTVDAPAQSKPAKVYKKKPWWKRIFS